MKLINIHKVGLFVFIIYDVMRLIVKLLCALIVLEVYIAVKSRHAGHAHADLLIK